MVFVFKNINPFLDSDVCLIIFLIKVFWENYFLKKTIVNKEIENNYVFLKYLEICNKS